MNHSRLTLAACVLLLAGISASGCGSSSKNPPANPVPQQPIHNGMPPQGNYYPQPSGQLQPPLGNAPGTPRQPSDNDDSYVPMNYNY